MEGCSGCGLQMQEVLAPLVYVAETGLQVDASGLDVGRAGQLGEARQLAISDMDDAPGARGDDGVGLCGDRRGAHAALGFTDRRKFRPGVPIDERDRKSVV